MYKIIIAQDCFRCKLNAIRILFQQYLHCTKNEVRVGRNYCVAHSWGRSLSWALESFSLGFLFLSLLWGLTKPSMGTLWALFITSLCPTTPFLGLFVIVFSAEVLSWNNQEVNLIQNCKPQIWNNAENDLFPTWQPWLVWQKGKKKRKRKKYKIF